MVGAHQNDADGHRLVGRAPELARLESLVEQALAGCGRLALISGAPGIGKTALVEAARAAAIRQGALTLSGGCYDLTVTPPYGPWRELLRRDTRGASRADELPVDAPSLEESGLPGGTRDQAGILERVGDFILMLAQRCPLVLTLEDLHWADAASLELLRHVARRAAGAPVLILTTYRESTGAPATPVEALAPLFLRESRAERIRLRPLDRAALDELIANRYQMDAAGQARLGDYLTRHSEGIPLFALELLRGLEEERVLEPQGDGWRMTAPPNDAVPPILQTMVGVRVSRLPEDIARGLRLAAVIGQQVELELWGSLLGLNEEQVIAAVERMEAEQLVDALPAGDTMRFQHALIQRAVYHSISPPRRRQFHRRVAEALEDTAGPDPDQVAWHFGQAGDPRQAAWLERAAERARRGYAWQAAAERLIAADALALDDEDPRVAGWRNYRIGRLQRHADPTDARGWLEAAERHGARAADPALVAFARFDQGHVRVLGGDYASGLAMMRSGDELLDTLELNDIDADVGAWIADALPERSPGPALADRQGDFGVTRRGTLVQWLVEAGYLSEARRIGEAFVVEPAQLIDYPDQWFSSRGDAWFGLGRVYAWLGDPDAARVALDRALECYRRIDHHLLMAATQRVILEEVVIPYRTEQVAERERLRAAAENAYRRATGVADEGLIAGFASLGAMVLDGAWHEALGIVKDAHSRDQGIIVWRHRVAAVLARLERERGNLEETRQLIAVVLPAGPDTPPGSTTHLRAIEMQLLAADIALDAGDLDLAGRWLDTLDAWLAWNGAVRWRAEALLARARWLAARGDLDQAIDQADRALAAAREPRQPLAELAALRLRGELHGRRGHLDAALEDLGLALARAEGCAAPYEVALTRLSLADARAAAGASVEAQALLRQACEEFEALGAQRALISAREILMQIAGRDAVSPAPFGLSKREIEVLTLVAAGMTDAQVADQLSISYRTVTTHLTSIFNKLNVNSRVAATRIALEHGIV